jgi:predicted nucleotidyltransferase
MAGKNAVIKQKIKRFYGLIKDKYPVKRIFLYGSHVRGTATKDSDIDIGVVIDLPNHNQRIEIMSDLFLHAMKVDTSIEPRCIFWDEYKNPPKASILSDIIRKGIKIA